MKCQHQFAKITNKCITCSIYTCLQCSKNHKNQKHEMISASKCSQEAIHGIDKQINKINMKLKQLQSLSQIEYEPGLQIIQACKKQMIECVHNVFQEIKKSYRSICDNFWKQQNILLVQELQIKKQNLVLWKTMLSKSQKNIIDFQQQNSQFFQQNQEQLLDSHSQSFAFMQSNSAPKISFDETALRRFNQVLGKIIYITSGFRFAQEKNSTLTPQILNKKLGTNKTKKQSIKRTPSRRSYKQYHFNNDDLQQYISLVKFVEDKNILYQYIVQNKQQQLIFNSPGLQHQKQQNTLKKIQFREFVTPMRSVSVSVRGEVFLIGGYNNPNTHSPVKSKKHSPIKVQQIQLKPNREVWYYDRPYNTMRIACLLKKGRVGHCLFAVENYIYVFGGNGVKTMQRIDIKKKKAHELCQYSKQITGCSMTQLKDKLYLMGGYIVIEQDLQNIYSTINNESIRIPNKTIAVFNLQTLKFDADIQYLNADIYPMPICPILQPINSEQIIIIGGYFQHQNESYNNSHVGIYSLEYNYVANYGKGQNVYPILANSCNVSYKQDFYSSVNDINKTKGCIIGLVDMKRSRRSHGPNLGALFTYELKDQNMKLQNLGL